MRAGNIKGENKFSTCKRRIFSVPFSSSYIVEKIDFLLKARIIKIGYQKIYDFCRIEFREYDVSCDFIAVEYDFFIGVSRVPT